MLKYLFYIIIGIILYILINSIEKFNIGGLRAKFEYDSTTNSWERTIYATRTDIDNDLVLGLTEGTDYEIVDDYTVPAPEPLQGNIVFITGDEGNESGTTLQQLYQQLTLDTVKKFLTDSRDSNFKI